MIRFEEFFLPNGLQVLVHEDPKVSVALVNLLYKVGSRDESPAKTGFAHLFEHLMFGGSKHIPEYDRPLQIAGGDNNAFTSPDITNYYITLPNENLETAFWLESDRMLSLSFNPEVLEVQRKVVIEEYKQRYINQPYGDVWHILRKMAYTVHPYRWPTIGAELSHIEQATLEDVKDFFHRFYRPDNAVLVVAGHVKRAEVQQLAEKWFSEIPAGNYQKPVLPVEPKQTSPRVRQLHADVPVAAYYKTFHMCAKYDDNYTATDLLSDILGRGKSSRLYAQLVKEQQLFSSLSASINGAMDPGLFIVSGKLAQGVTAEQADEAVKQVISDLQQNGLKPGELEKVKNQAESTLAFSELEVFSRALNLAVAATLGNPDLVNQGSAFIQSVQEKDVLSVAEHVLADNNSTTLFYMPKA